MHFLNFNNIDFQNDGNTPLPVKTYLLSVLSLIVLGLSYLLLSKQQFESLEYKLAGAEMLEDPYADFDQPIADHSAAR